jgi:hypothetical protein
MIKYIPILLLISSATISADSIRVPNASKAALYYAKKKWEVEKDGQRHEIANEFIDKIARGIPEDQIEDFLKYVALRVSELGNGEYSLKAHPRGLGGGPMSFMELPKPFAVEHELGERYSSDSSS